MPYLAPSILSADFGEMAAAVRLCSDCETGFVHADVMDGRFVPNITFGPKMIADLREPAGDLLMSVHLMIAEPERYVEQFCEAGGDYVSIHIEATPHAHRAIQAIRNAGKKAGLALNPGTPVTAAEPLLDELDLLLLMTVNPGFGGQAFIASGLRKIERARRLIDGLGQIGKTLIEVDGGVKLNNIADVAAAGADVIVAGSAVFGSDHPAKAIEELTKRIDN
ncbi:MAG: ribulose-phosphate 3-epimerase [bacterium]|nr:ribulose-phosphate 3-epimerase [bacterium]